MKFTKRFSLVVREDIVIKSQRCLWLDAGKPAREYLLSIRKLNEEVLQSFQLGYIPEFINHQLRGRIILPLFDPSHNLIAISSRQLKAGGFLPVYWHESYEKQFYLYGMDLAKESIRQFKFVIVVEGQFDVLQLVSQGVHNVVALCGNKISDIQMTVIQRYCEDIILVLDTDENLSGQKGAAKILDKSRMEYGFDPSQFPIPRNYVPSPQSRRIANVEFGENCDPDEFVRTYGVGEFRRKVREVLHELRSN